MNSALIILNYNSYDDTVACADRLLSFDMPCRMIIVDNHSPDGSGDRLSGYYGDQDRIDVVLADSNLGYGAGNNLGIRYARDRYAADIIGILNPDVEIPDRSVIERMIGILTDHPDCGIVGAVIDSRDDDINLNLSAWPVTDVGRFVEKQSLLTRRYSRPFVCTETEPGLCAVDCVAGCFFLARMSCMEQIGFFDEDVFLYNEEDILGILCKRHGFGVLLAKDVRYYHNHHDDHGSSLTFRQKIMSTHSSYISAAHICRKYYNGKGLIRLWFIEMFNRLYLTGAYLKHRSKP